MFQSKLNHILACHPIIKTDIIKGNNAYLFDSDGNKIIDFESGMWCTALGHNNSKINEVISQQAGKIINTHFKLSGDVSQVLAINLLGLLNFNDGKAVFLSSGSEAVEFGIRISKLISQNHKILTFSTSYLSAFPTTSLPRNENLWIQIDFLQCNNCTKTKCTTECKVLKHINFNTISTFVLEPGSSSGRVLFPPDRLVKFLSENVKKHGGYVVVNEVTTGFGRTGEWFGHNHYEINPDIVVLGKALGNGYPVSAVIMTDKIASEVEGKKFSYAQSHQNDPLGCVIANEVIRIFKEENIIQNSREKGEFFLYQLHDIKSSCSVVKDIRGRGLMIAVELSIPNSAELIFEKMLNKGYFIGTTPAWNVLRFFPPLTISKDDIIKMCKELRKQLKELEKTVS